MSNVDLLTKRNDDFATHRFSAGLPLFPTLRMVIIGCVDPRVDPADVLGVELGEAVVIRNVGGRITPATMQTLAMLGAIARAEGANTASGLELVVLHHTDCGITRLTGNPDMLAGYFGVGPDKLATKAITDPYAAVAIDVAALRANPALPAAWLVSGLVYDVATGRIETMIAPAPLRVAGGAA